MINTLSIIWIDDTPGRVRASDNLKSAINNEVQFVNLHKMDVETVILNLIANQSEPDLIILDHSLHSAESKSLKTGSSVALVIRESWQNCPIISVTSADLSDVNARHREAYEVMISAESIGKNYDRIKAIADGFKLLKESNPQTLDELLKLLEVDEDDKSKIIKIMPKELKDESQYGNIGLELYRWVDEILVQRPGFLLDDLWAATLIGLNMDGFEQVREKFSECLFQGIFSTSDINRYWRSKLFSRLGELVDGVDLPWKLGRKLLPDNPQYYSVSYIKDEPYPETVAYLDETSESERVVIKLKYTEPHPKFESMLYFEEISIMATDLDE